MKEREISLRDLMFEILLKWRMIIVAMVIGGVLFGGYSYWQSTKAVAMQTEQSNTVITLEDLENTLTNEQKSKVKVALGYERYSEYYGDSLLMQIDAQNVPTMDMIFCITTTEAKRTNVIVAMYERLLTTGLTQWLVQNGMIDDDATKVSELVSVKSDIEKTFLILETVNKDSVYISVVHQDGNKCQELANQVKEYVLSQKETVVNAYGEHELALVSETFAMVVDSELLTKQRETLDNVMISNTNADKLRQLFTEQEMQYYNFLKCNANDAVAGEVKNIHGVAQYPSINFKYVIAGMILCAFVCVFYVFLAYILNNKLCVGDDWGELYGILKFGVISETVDKKIFLGFVDKWIIALRDRNTRKFTQEEAKEIVTVAIKMALKKSGGKAVSLIGCDVKKNTEDICNSIKERLEKENVKVLVLDNVLYNAEVMGKLSEVDNAVLIEKAGVTMYDEIEKELELLDRHNINVLGGVVVD